MAGTMRYGGWGDYDFWGEAMELGEFDGNDASAGCFPPRKILCLHIYPYSRMMKTNLTSEARICSGAWRWKKVRWWVVHLKARIWSSTRGVGMGHSVCKIDLRWPAYLTAWNQPKDNITLLYSEFYLTARRRTRMTTSRRRKGTFCSLESTGQLFGMCKAFFPSEGSIPPPKIDIEDMSSWG